MISGVIEASPGDAHVFIHHLLSLAPELQCHRVPEQVKVQAQEGHDDTQGHSVLDHAISAVVGQLADWHRA